MSTAAASWGWGRAIRPAYEGIETFQGFRHKRGRCFGRAIRPAYEGIETTPHYRVPARGTNCRAIRPAYEGIETVRYTRRNKQRTAVSRDPPRL